MKNLNDLIIESPNIPKDGLFVGYIYVFRNKINEKIYIGKTIELYTLRFNEHKYNAFTKLTKTYFYNALRKYGWDNFDRFVIYQTNYNNSKKEIDKIICEKEKFYINLFRSDCSDYGYNLTSGGDGICGYKFSEETKTKMSLTRSGENHWHYGKFNGYNAKKVLQFDLDFNFIKEWESSAEIARQLNYKTSNIIRCCSNDINTYKGFIWVHKEDYFEYFEGYLQKYKSRAKCKSNDKAVLQYDFLGNFIEEYISGGIAAKKYKCDGSTITGAAKGKFPQGKGFIWIYKEDFSEKLLQDYLFCEDESDLIYTVEDDLRYAINTGDVQYNDCELTFEISQDFIDEWKKLKQ